MEHISLLLNQGEEFDKITANSLPHGSDLRLITKDGATQNGNAAAMLTFTAQLPDGTHATAQIVTTVKNLQMAFAGLNGRYGPLE